MHIIDIHRFFLECAVFQSHQFWFLSVIWFFFPRPTLSRWHEGNLAYLMLITVVNAPDVNAPYHIWHESHLSSGNEVDCQGQAERICGIWTGNLPLFLCDSHCSTLWNSSNAISYSNRVESEFITHVSLFTVELAFVHIENLVQHS